ncbi:MAG: helix-turn-helix transcriptional regulator [Dermatophilaceae bacterium]|nr:WYL domain-containing protein [Intrasporangiaceae bacterium]
MAPAPSAKTERLMNLVMTLLWTRRPLSRHELRRTVEQYRLAPSDEAFERMFERDKDELRELGVPLQTVESDVLFEDEVGYRIHSDDYVLPEIEFETDELVVLGLAARTWSHGTLGGAAAQALRKLQATQPDTDDAPSGLVEPRLGTSEPTFPEILRCVQELREIRFGYRRADATQVQQRRVQPWALSSIRGHWYLTGLDLDRDEQRVFRLSRIAGAVTRHGPSGAYTIPPDARPADLARAAVPQEPTPVVEVSVAAGAGAGLRRSACVVPHEGSDNGGWDRLRVETLPRDAVATEIAVLLASARQVTPDEVRARVIGHLAAVLGAHEREDIDTVTAHSLTALTAERARSSRRHGTIEPATARLSRLLAMVPWLVHRQGIDLAEAAHGLGVSEDQLRSDLDLLFLCGYGSMPDELIDVESEGGRIFIRNADTIARPLRLAWDEAVTLIVGLRALAGVPGLRDDDAVVRALAKLEHAAGDLAATADRVSAHIDEGVDPGLLATLRSALAAGRRVHLVYEGAARDARTERDVDIMRVVSADGRWYVEGWCHRAQDTRLFRLDRIQEATPLDVDGTPPSQARTRDLGAGAYHPAADATTATVLLAPAARWVCEYYPVEEQVSLELPSGVPAEAVTMRVSRTDWLLRLVVRLGGHATILAPDDLRETLMGQVRAARDQHASS